MNGAENLVQSAADAGVSICFANAGTTELPLVAALDGQPRIRPVPTLFEGVATGAADGFARIAGRPALTLLHLGPGLSNGSANLHNARRARTPIVNIIGEHASWHQASDPPLASDVAGLAGPVSVWVRTSDTAGAVAGDTRDAIAAARGLGGPATLIVPADCQWSDAPTAYPAAPAKRARPSAAASPGQVDAVAQALPTDRPAALLLGGSALGAAGQRAAQRIALATGAVVLVETFPARQERGRDLPSFPRLGYFPEMATGALPAGGVLILAGASSPVTFFGYPGVPSSAVPAGTQVVTLAAPDEDAAAALDHLADLVGAAPDAVQPTPRPQRPTGRLDTSTLGAAIAALQPEGAIVVDEGITSSGPYAQMAAGAAPHTSLTLTGGAIGLGLPLATGAALGAPDRQVIDVQADGSALYTAQALWTQAHEGLDVTTVICANGSYRILQAEIRRAGGVLGPAAAVLTGLGGPTVDWVRLSTGFGVPATRASTADELVAQLAAALQEPGPHLIEAVLS